MRDLIATAVRRGGLPADDVVGLLVPLFGQVAQLHEVGRVAPLRGLAALSVVDGRIGLDPTGATPPQRNRAATADVERAYSPAIEVGHGVDVLHDLSGGAADPAAAADSERTGARIVAGWQTWEHLAGHHDELTDIASLGQLLAALACGLDLAEEADAAELAAHHRNLFAINPRIHPVLAAVASSMLEPDRHRRGQDLPGLTQRLESYRDQPEDFDLDRVLAGGAGAHDRRGLLLAHLRDRLFDLSRRNPLLHFRRTQRSLNLTEASVPLVLDLRNITSTHLFTWGGPISRKLLSGKQVEVASVVRWDDAPYATQALDALISTARRDRAEYGQDQLRLVVAFLHWHDLKNAPAERISSPLVLAPAALTKKRGVRDSYRLALTSTEAEVNPVVRHQLRELYGIDLPERIDLSAANAIESICETLRGQAQASEPGLQVNLVDKPRIEVVRHRAQVALQAYRRRRSASAPMVGRRHYAYSYGHPNYAPLGIQIFRDRLQRQPIPMAVELGDRPAPRRAVAPDTVEQDLFSLQQPGEANPYSWDVDLCSVTLANFNYRTLSLVRDYAALIAEPRPNAPFDELFSTAPRDVPAPNGPLPLRDSYLVVPADGSQTVALAQARTADNFVIQGPPGTGKSQTITNLIADCVARGLRVLFVCQKRAALDVVHARLRSQGLDELCTLIHDSQADRKTFVHGLKDTYERWLADPEPVSAVEARRDELVAEIESAIAEIGTYESVLTADASGTRLVDVVERLVAAHGSRWGEDLEPALRRLLPAPGAWAAAAPSVEAIAAALRRAEGTGILARSPLRLLDPRVLDGPRADAEVAHRAGLARPAVDALDAVVARGDDPAELALADARAVAGLHALLAPVAARGRGNVLDPAGPAAYELQRAVETHTALQLRGAQTAAAAAGWHQPLGPEDAAAALDVARRKEKAAMRFFSGEWRRVRTLVRAGYRSPPDRQFAPTVAEALETLVAAHRASAEAAAFGATVQQEWGHPDPSTLAAGIDVARRHTGSVARWRDLLATDPAAATALHDLDHRLAELERALEGLLIDVDDVPLAALRADLSALTGPATQATVRAVAAPMRELAAAPGGVLLALRRLDAEPDQIGYAVAAATVQEARATAPVLDRLDGDALARQLDRVTAALPVLRRVNAEVIIAGLRQRFLDNVEHSQRSLNGMEPDDRARKKEWATGRRELEHEFGKVRAYKAIRQLASGESGAVVAGMRPVWLMSPASVSDALPLAETFDVVVYDEASQVPVEEAVPALHRARQVIVVGDRMQLPPTTYFQTREIADADDDSDDSDEQRLGVVLDADSFLAVASVRLPSTMLTWHYRSRYEALIQFSNAAFYEGRLATIPDRAPSEPRLDSLEIEGDSASAVEALADGVLARSVSFIRVRDGVYEQRTNLAEARVIAELVRELLRRDTGLTFGIVAFSEAQQGEIERGLERLAATDGEFADRYEAELTREEDGQGVGLFVKNLENVQGDERDVIIMSVCYAPGPDGRMRMNFGPINNAGGEKRLNVIFSRAKQHMALVSTIDHTAITNVYNDGANTLRQFLHYADAVSRGDSLAARAVLTGRRGRSVEPDAVGAPMVDQLAAALRARGFDVATSVGQSVFRCDLAVRRPGRPSYDVAVLADHVDRLDRHPLDERRLTQPAALQSAGWQVVQVLSTEWISRPDAVLDTIVDHLGPPIDPSA